MSVHTKIEKNLTPRDIDELAEVTGNLYESVVVISRRANAIQELDKEELVERLSEVTSVLDVNDDVYMENKEQVDISKAFERMQKPYLRAIEEFKEDKIYHTYNIETD